MTEKVNIPRTVEDPKYRYQMPLLQQKVEGKGLNIHTNLVNLKEVAKSLRTSHEYILKYFAYELSLQVKEKNNDMWINGEINKNDILKVLDKFIDKFILCANCHFPEMFLRVNKNNNTLAGYCYSCGKKTNIDQTHKLSSYIMKYPPQNQSEFKTLNTDINFDNLDVIDSAKVENRRKLIIRIRDSTFNPFSEDDKPLFAEIQTYLAADFVFATPYLFNQSHAETIYKLIKRLRIEKTKWDRVGFIIFTFIFNVETIKDATNRGLLFKKVLERHNMGDFVSHEYLLNLEYLYYEANKDKDYKKVASTRLKNLYDPGMLEEV